MDIKRKYFNLVQANIEKAYQENAERLKVVADMFGQCMENGGVVQLFGVRHGDELVNELNYRAGGIAPFHAFKFMDLVLREKLDQKEVDSGEVFNDISVIDRFNSIYQLDDRDMYTLISYYGNEPLVIEFARRAKEKGQKVVAIVNMEAYKKNGGTLLDYADAYLDMCAQDPDIAMDIDGVPVGQLSSTVANTVGQMLTAEVYNWFVSHGKEAPVLLSANVKGADIHNNSLTDPYERRVR